MKKYFNKAFIHKLEHLDNASATLLVSIQNI